MIPSRDDMWWDPSLTHPCGLPGHVHELAFCQEFWYLTPEERHQKLLPGSICKHCLGPLTLCSPNGVHCSNQVPVELICSGCRRKGDEWGQPPLNVLFCTRTDPDHEKQPLGVIVEAAEQLVGGWDMLTKVNLVGVKHPAAGFVCRAHEPLDPVLSLDLEGASFSHWVGNI